MKIVNRALFALVLAGAVGAAAAQQDQANPSTGSSANQSSSAKTSPVLSMADQKFIKNAADGGMAEVELGQLAVEKGSSDKVKKFGQRMVDDHSKANDRLKEIAVQKGIDLPTTPGAKQRATKDRLSKLSGDQFDKAYMTDMLADHKKDVAEFRRESKAAKDTDIKSFASETLPTLEEHLKQAQSLAPKGKTDRSAMQEPNASQR